MMTRLLVGLLMSAASILAQGFGGTPPPSSGSGPTTNQNSRRIAVHFDGHGSALSGTTVTCQSATWSGTITSWTVVADASGSATIGIRYVSYASYSNEAGYSGYSDLTGGGTAPGLSSATKATSSTLTSWTTTITAGNVYCIQLSSPSTAKKVDVYLSGVAN